MLKKALYLSCLCLCLFALGTYAKASTIGPGSSCASCFGSSYTLSYTATANPDVFDIYLAVDASGYNQANTDVLNAVSLKLASNGSDISSVSLLSSSASGFSSTILGGISSGGCHANGNNGFFCSRDSSGGVEVGHSGDLYNFEWQLTLTAPGNLLTALNDASIKASYLTAAGHNAGLTSEDITLSPGTSPVPEPASFVLLGTGLLGAAGALRRKLSA